MNRYDLAMGAWRKLSGPGRYSITEAIFLRLLGLVYLIAFASLRPQVLGLFGSHGIVPVALWLSDVKASFGSSAYTSIPTVFWFGASDRLLEGACALGCAAAILLITGFLSRAASVVCWILYLSLVTTGAPFMNFQWDALLLESGFLALWAGAPWLNWAFRLLLFRLMFESGLVKLTSGDVNWWNLHALRFHFLTQPLPTPLAWYADHLPPVLLDALTGTTLAIELVVPFGVFGPRKVRRATAFILIVLQTAIMLTGNYGFFNLLTIALCVWCFDDRTFSLAERFLRIRPIDLPGVRACGNIVVLLLMLAGAWQVLRFRSTASAWPVTRRLEQLVASFEIVNTYGLFAVMTTSRPEIVLQRSDDGEHWVDYEFPYKPGKLNRGLPTVAPYMPRLDWQMWFAALGTFNENRWVGALMYRLLVGEKTVEGLLLQPPFPDRPRYLRAELYDYRFTSWEERRRNGALWQRTLRGDWFGPVSLTGR